MNHTSTTHKETYCHIRESNEHWNGATIFARLEPDGWYASIAICSKQDQFCRRTGRTVARRRYFEIKKDAAHAALLRKEEPSNGNYPMLSQPTDKWPNGKALSDLFPALTLAFAPDAWKGTLGLGEGP